MLQRILKTFLVALVVLLLTPSFGSAQLGRARDRGQYEIVQAQYGTSRNNIDVTSRVQDLARQDVSFEIENDAFGSDPDPNVLKTLRIQARGTNGRIRVFEYKEGSRVDGSMFLGSDSSDVGLGRSRTDERWENERTGNAADEGRFEIMQALYGTARHNVDVTNRLRQLARRDQTFRMDNNTFGVDPDPNVVKTLRIYAQGPNGRERVFEYAEGSTIDGSMFTGWSSGRFGQTGRTRTWDQNNTTAAERFGRASLGIVRATYGAGRQQRDVTARLQSQVQDGRISISVDNNVMGGDPAPNVPKELLVTYTDNRGRQHEVRVAEGQQLNLP